MDLNEGIEPFAAFLPRIQSTINLIQSQEEKWTTQFESHKLRDALQASAAMFGFEWSEGGN